MSEAQTDRGDGWASTRLPASMRTLAAARSIRPRDEGDAGFAAELARLPVIAVAERGDGADGDFVVRGRLGEGGMGLVDRAWQRALAREVAVKRIRDRADAEAVRALLTEARVTGSLEHPNIIPIHAVGRDPDGNPLLVMKRVDGARLSHLIAQPEHPLWDGLPPDRLRWQLETLMQVCHAVELAHSRGVLHRDLKLDNVMVGEFGEIYVLDWGLALELADGADAVEDVPVAGTPASMAPEMLIGGPLDRRTDVYLLGAALHELLTGTPRHTGATLADAIGSILASDPVAYVAIPDELAAIANRATARQPEARFPSVRAFRAALVEFLEHRESTVLCVEAERLRTEAVADGAGRRAQLGAARFAYRQALLRWGANARALAGLRAVLTELFELEIAEGNRAAAEALRADLPDPDATLATAIAALDERIAADRRRVEELEWMAEDRDPARHTAERRRGLTALMLAAAVSIVAVLIARWLGVLRVGAPQLFASALATAVVALVVMRFARIGRSSLVNRRLGWSITIVACAAAIARGAAWWQGATVPAMLTFELLGYAAAAVLVGITVHRSVLAAAPVIGAGFVAALAWPAWSLEIASLAMLVGPALVIQRWLRTAGFVPRRP